MNRFEQILFDNWGYKEFRSIQLDIIKSVVEERKDTLALLPTGGGKSVIFQVSALALEGICIVVTPLIALMKDQVDNLKKRKIKAAAIYSGMTQHQIDITLDNCVYGDYKFLYVSPERLGTDIFKARMQRMKVNLLAIDEAHCISQWGYDFRPAYLKIADMRTLLPDVPVLALTATATQQVVEDLQDKLHFKERNVFKMSFERNNLIYMVRYTEDKLNYLLKIVKAVQGTGIVYVRIRKRTREIAAFLNENNISADYFHAGLSLEMKDKKQEDWKENRNRIIVSTNAFGMGIDKPDVRFVVHMDLPDSLEAYFQEAGRGGRDGKKSVAILLVQNADISNLKKRVDMNFPPIEEIKNIYNMLGNFFQLPLGSGKMQIFDFSMAEFAANYKLPIHLINSSLGILKMGEYLEYSEEKTSQSFIKFTIGRDDLYKIQVANPKIDSFIKLILRNYTGVFTEYAGIDENYLAKIGNTNRNAIYQYFKTLAKAQILDYIPLRQNPFIQYLMERLPKESLYISPEIYKVRKERYEKLISSVIYYAETAHKCRSRILMEYFGQTNAQDCGQCDVCKANSQQDAPEKYLNQIKNAGLHKFTLPELTEKTGKSFENVQFLVKQLMEKGLISKLGDEYTLN